MTLLVKWQCGNTSPGSVYSRVHEFSEAKSKKGEGEGGHRLGSWIARRQEDMDPGSPGGEGLSPPSLDVWGQRRPAGVAVTAVLAGVLVKGGK